MPEFWVLLLTFVALTSNIYTLKTNKLTRMTAIINFLVILFALALLVYSRTYPNSMIKKILNIETMFYMVFLALPCLFALRKLKKLRKDY